MLQIRSEQLSAMGEARLAGMIHGHLACHHAESIAPLSADVRAQLIRDGIVRARGYGMSAPSSIGAVVALMLEIGPDFDRNPALRQALSDPSVAPDDRFEILADRIAALMEQHSFDTAAPSMGRQRP